MPHQQPLLFGVFQALPQHALLVLMHQLLVPLLLQLLPQLPLLLRVSKRHNHRLKLQKPRGGCLIVYGNGTPVAHNRTPARRGLHPTPKSTPKRATMFQSDAFDHGTDRVDDILPPLLRFGAHEREEVACRRSEFPLLCAWRGEALRLLGVRHVHHLLHPPVRHHPLELELVVVDCWVQVPPVVQLEPQLVKLLNVLHVPHPQVGVGHVVAIPHTHTRLKIQRVIRLCSVVCVHLFFVQLVVDLEHMLPALFRVKNERAG
mmetsp:Transcript_2477/g.5972  ORF Transcript_2477/g.5972 Transcript_2477/m.5972 type:complete len:260 (-) Transcript_2477:183-962(-)